jgi:hypothetical protein
VENDVGRSCQEITLSRMMSFDDRKDKKQLKDHACSLNTAVFVCLQGRWPLASTDFWILIF